MTWPEVVEHSVCFLSFFGTAVTCTWLVVRKKNPK